MKHFIGIEAGGTKFICAMGNTKGEISQRASFPTETPTLTLQKVIDYITAQGKIDAIGIACFGPLDLDKHSPHYGYITATPKPTWQYTNIAGILQNQFHVPTFIDTDVNAAALGEGYWGAGKGLDNFMYLTVGTGIGGGAMINHKLVHGALHPEMGHLFIPHDKTRDPFPGVCPYHQDCLEGLASGPAMMKRWNLKAALDLPPEHEGWELEAHYLALACANYTLTLSPKKIILGGGVMKYQPLFAKIHQHLPSLLNEYIPHKNLKENIQDYIVPATLGENAGIAGALALAMQHYQHTPRRETV